MWASQESTGAVNADWNANSGLAQILNKPSVVILVEGLVPDAMLPERGTASTFDATADVEFGADSNDLLPTQHAVKVFVAASIAQAVIDAGNISSTDDLPPGTTNKYFTDTLARAVPLTGLVTTDGSDLEATDTMLIAMGKLQKQTQDIEANILVVVDDVLAELGDLTDNSIIDGNIDRPPSGDAVHAALLLKADISSLGTSATLNVSTDGTLAANSDSVIATQKAVKTFVENAVVGLFDFKTAIDASANPNYPAASKADAYVFSVAGKIGGASGVTVAVGDLLLAIADNAGGTQASVGTSWIVLEKNLIGALLASNNLSDLTDAAAARTALSLGNVENKSPATILGEMTLAQVVAALAYTPVNPSALGTSSTLNFAIDGTMAADSDTLIPTQQAVRTFVEAAIVAAGGITTTDDLDEGTTNKYFHEALVLATALTGFSTASGATVTSASTLIESLGQLQNQATAAVSSLALKAPLASPPLTGVPTAPTAAAGTNTTQIATTAFVSTAVADLVASSPAALNTLNELAAALGNDANYAASTATSIGLKANTASPTLTGNVGVGTSNSTSQSLKVNKTITGATTALGVQVDGVVQSDVTALAAYHSTSAATLAAAFTCTGLHHYRAVQGTIGAGSTVTSQYGYTVDSTMIGATNNFGFYGGIAAGSNRWNIYMAGTALNYMAGSLLIGTNTDDGTNKLQVNGGATFLDNALVRAMLKDCGMTVLDKGNSSTTTQTVDYTAGSYQKITATGNHTLAFSNWSPTGNYACVLLELVNYGAFTITLPTMNYIKSDQTSTTVFASSGITFASAGTTRILVWTTDGGTTLYCKAV